jgi:predicted AlkP superfamily phosphohydrolase/phosphomutase
VAQVLEQFGDDPDTLILVLSDHGFASFRRGVNLNRWLLELGYLRLREDVTQPERKKLAQLFSGGSFFEQVDWSRTRAFALGLGAIYINRMGVDPHGVVLPSDVEPLAREIRDRLLALQDPASPGRPVVASVGTRWDDFAGRWQDDAPALMVGFARGYRVSWQTALGGIPPVVFEDNRSPWSGDHCSLAPGQIPGFVAANRPLRATPRHLRDLAPTVLGWLGVPVPPGRAGRSLLDD